MVYSKNCLENRYGASCFKFGNYNLVGRGTASKDTTAAYDAYTRGCSYGHALCCHNAALMHQTGRANPDNVQDYIRSAEILERGCTLGNVPSCQLLSTYFITGKPGIEKDMKRAFTYAEKACDGGHMAACANLGRMYRLGEGVDRNMDLANKYLQKAKDLHRRDTETERPLTFGE